MIPSETIRSSVTNDGVVLLDIGNGKVYNSNAVGARIWVKLQEGLDDSTIIDQIAAEFDVAAGKIRPDVDEFIGKLTENGILVSRS